MSDPRELRCYDYVPARYETVRDVLRRDAAGLFQRATRAAIDRADQIVATLRVDVGPVEVGVDVQIVIRGIEETATVLGDRATRIQLAWTAARSAGLFPSMEATLSVYPLSARETQLDLDGRYRPPLGAVGNALDAVLGQRIAQAAVLRFVQETAARLRSELGGDADGP